jgi:MipA family protein
MLAAASAALWTARDATAQMMEPPPNAPMSKSPEVLIGLGLSNAPAYLGADERKTRPLPMLAARWRSGWFAGLGGVGWQFSGSDLPASGGLRLGLDPGRDEDDADALRGMGDIKPRAEIGAFGSAVLVPGTNLGSSVRFGSGNDRNGLLVDLSLRSSWSITPTQRLAAGVTATLANTSAMQSAFGVDADQSLRSGYALYTPGSSLRDVRLNLGYMIELDSNMVVQLGLSASSLAGDAKVSPLTRDRSSVAAIATLVFRL